MKIKKSELIALIKEEIMAEARFDRGMTMMDDPYDDNEPEPRRCWEYGTSGLRDPRNEFSN